MGGRGDCAHRHGFTEHQHMVFPLKKVRHWASVEGGVWDIQLTSFACQSAPCSLRNSISECGWGPWSASVLEIATHLPLLATVGPPVMMRIRDLWTHNQACNTLHPFVPDPWLSFQTNRLKHDYSCHPSPEWIITPCVGLNHVFLQSNFR